MRRVGGRGLSSGTVAERIAPESVTRLLSGFVHRNISRRRPGRGTRSSLARLHKGPIGGAFLKSSARAESNQNWQRVNRIPSAFVIPGRCAASNPESRDSGSGACAPSRNDGMGPHCVLATRGGVAWVMNWVASSVAGPSGVGIRIQNGTRIRVPATGTNAISMLRWAARYLITGRSGM